MAAIKTAKINDSDPIDLIAAEQVAGVDFAGYVGEQVAVAVGNNYI